MLNVNSLLPDLYVRVLRLLWDVCEWCDKNCSSDGIINQKLCRWTQMQEQSNTNAVFCIPCLIIRNKDMADDKFCILKDWRDQHGTLWIVRKCFAALSPEFLDEIFLKPDAGSQMLLWLAVAETMHDLGGLTLKHIPGFMICFTLNDW